MELGRRGPWLRPTAGGTTPGRALPAAPRGLPAAADLSPGSPDGAEARGRGHGPARPGTGAGEAGAPCWSRPRVGPGLLPGLGKGCGWVPVRAPHLRRRPGLCPSLN